MSVVLEFSVASDAFRLGRALSVPSEMRFELERVVPTGTAPMPFVWATGDDHAAFEAAVRNDPAVGELLVLDRIDDRGLYRIRWTESPTDLLEAIAAADGTILEARGDGDWTFRLRFEDHDALSRFHADVTERELPIRIDRTYALSAAAERGDRFDLTAEQREALLLALRRGYFATPREAGLDELADELHITRQALSDRVRRANEKVLRGALGTAVTGSESGP